MPKRKNRKAKAPKKLKKIHSPRQLLAVKAITELVRNSKGQKKVTLGRILITSGYSKSMSLQPSRVIQTDSFQELLEEHLPDGIIAKVHGDLLEASVLSHYVFPAKETDEEITEIVESVKGCKVMKIRKQHNWKRAYFWTPDNQSRLKAITEAYKVKSKYPAEKKEEEPDEIKVVKIINYGTIKV